MSFSIKKSHRYVNRENSTSSVVNTDPSSEDMQYEDGKENDEYTYFTTQGKSSTSLNGSTPVNPKKGGSAIRQVSNAQSDFY